MTLELDLGTAFGIIAALVAGFWGLITLTVHQFERRQDERFKTLTDTLTEQKEELDEHMKKQDNVMAELRRVEIAGTNELRRIETEFARAQLANHQTFQTKNESVIQHAEILTAIRAISSRIDEVIAERTRSAKSQ